MKETSTLYCSLADVTGNTEFYHTAWDLSNHRSARAMRGLAFHHLRACEVCVIFLIIWSKIFLLYVERVYKFVKEL